MESEKEASLNLMRRILADDSSSNFIKSTLLKISQRAPTANEVMGYLEGMLEIATPIKSLVALDLCGTGGDGKNTFNISTATAFVLAAMDVPVAKHGNSSASSKCGSSDVLKALGVKLPTTAEDVESQFKKANLVFLHAPYFYPALKKLAPIRKELGIRTIFNMLGPLASPVKPTFQMVGIANSELLDIYSAVLTQLKRDFVVVHADDGYDEISLTGSTSIQTASFVTKLTREELEIDFPISQADLKGADSPEENAQIIMTILEGEGTKEQNAVVAANAAVAAKLYYSENSYLELFHRALIALNDNSALERLELSLSES